LTLPRGQKTLVKQGVFGKSAEISPDQAMGGGGAVPPIGFSTIAIADPPRNLSKIENVRSNLNA